MPATTDCLVGLTGLTRAGSACFPLPSAPELRTAYTDSASGLYVDEVPGLSLQPTVGQTGANDTWTRLDKARNQALQDVAHRLGSRLSSDRPLFTKAGLLGGLGTGAYDAVNLRAVLRLPTVLRPGGALRLDSATLYTDTAVEDVPVLLDGGEVARLATNAGPVALSGVLVPLDGQVHELTAALPDGVRVRTNTVTCGCSNPFVAAMRLNLTDVRGRAGGFGVQITEVCALETPLCHALSQDEEIRRAVGFAVQFLTAANFCVGLLTDAAYNRYTMLEPKALEFLAGKYTQDAERFLLWLVGPEGISRVPHPCYVCAPSAWHPTRSRIK